MSNSLRRRIAPLQAACFWLVVLGLSAALADPPPRAVAPFDAAAAKRHQEAWARHLETSVERTNSVGLKLVLIPPGEFLMGSTPAQIEKALAQATALQIGADRRYIPTEGPQHRVVLTKPFRLGATEVTIGQFRKFLESSGYTTETERLGGKWQNKEPYLRSAFRFDFWPTYRSQYFGFRVVCEKCAE
jgi:formylglycine-generating enzyme required for sulfatase activity